MCQSAPAMPKAPDYTGAAVAQGAANKDAAIAGASLSNPNINSPYGNQTVTYANTGPDGNPQATVNQSLTPDAQAALNAQQQVQAKLAGLGSQGVDQASSALGQQFSSSATPLQQNFAQGGAPNYGPAAGLYGTAQGVGAGPSAQGGLDLSGIARMPVNAGMTGQQAILSRLQPQIQQNENATRQRLANQGLTQGGEAYTNAMRDQGNQENDLYSQAALQGINLDTQANQQGYNQALSSAGLYNSALGQNFGQNLQAQQSQNSAIGQNFGQAATSAGLYNQAQNQQYNQNLQSAQFSNQASDAQYQRDLAQYNQPLNRIAALMSGSQIQNPQFQAYSGQNVQASPLFQAAQAQGQYGLDQYGIKANQANSSSQGLYGLLGAGAGAIGQAGGFAAMFSDRRLKSNIVFVGSHPKGFGVYEYDIFGRHEIGVLADEVERLMPEAVFEHPSGFKMVDYGALDA